MVEAAAIIKQIRLQLNLLPERVAMRNCIMLLTLGSGVFFLTTLIFYNVSIIEKGTYIMAAASLIVVFTNIAGNLALTPNYGLAVAAAALLSPSALALILGVFITRKF